jgi:hypothetical protein
VNPTDAKRIALALLESWELTCPVALPTQLEHEEVCAWLGVDPKIGQEPAVPGPESEVARLAPAPDGKPEVGRG